MSELPSTFSVPAAGVVLSDVPFYDSSMVGVFGADLGFSYDPGLERINDTGSRWSMPILATLRVRF